MDPLLKTVKSSFCSESWLSYSKSSGNLLVFWWYIAKTLNHILGCLSCISVTKKCYQISFLDSALRNFSLVTVASLCFQKTYID